MINWKNFSLIPSDLFQTTVRVSPTVATLNIRKDDRRVYASVSSLIRKRAPDNRIEIYADENAQTLILRPADSGNAKAYHFNHKNGSLYCASFGHFLQQKGQAFPLRFVGEWDDEASVFVLKRQSDAAPKKAKAANKPRSKGLESLLPQK